MSTQENGKRPFMSLLQAFPVRLLLCTHVLLALKPSVPPLTLLRLHLPPSTLFYPPGFIKARKTGPHVLRPYFLSHTLQSVQPTPTVSPHTGSSDQRISAPPSVLPLRKQQCGRPTCVVFLSPSVNLSRMKNMWGLLPQTPLPSPGSFNI